jgi:hypothetical protein
MHYNGHNDDVKPQVEEGIIECRCGTCATWAVSRKIHPRINYVVEFCTITWPTRRASSEFTRRLQKQAFKNRARWFAGAALGGEPASGRYCDEIIGPASSPAAPATARCPVLPASR